MEMEPDDLASVPKADPSWKPAALALWHDARGEWELAHRACQDDASSESAWVHAYLHRKEGDEGNASYWYRRAGKQKPSTPPEEEWRQIAAALL